MVNGMKALDQNALAQRLIENKNPALAKAYAYVNENGGDPTAALNKLLQENGIDPAEVANLLK